ncbi:leucine-rich repeat domain-containing protein [Mycoplasma sp. 'Moose RK']|uniref:leucine-rich repeat domain-containing protein n=1 Tax=Mycoplasma sp. 'Moose RK' TaxID=2780095 RepID=UPI0018C2D9B1|nr:leucine-rich repeat domain-containing protein [Mycoplasma sp. 'Moose RK']MBG0730588.1 leucine-rich repeat domain-containing protein [Mycoplasma sp. 'Moose RK']
MQILLLSRSEAIKIIKNSEFFSNKILDLSSFNFHEIDNFAFSGLNLEIEKLILPASLLKIGESAFMLNRVKKVIFGENLVSIANSAFESNLIEELVFPKKLTHLSQSVFANNNLKRIVIPDWIDEIEDDCFADNKLENIQFSSLKTSVKTYAFVGNSPKKVEILGEFILENGSESLNFCKLTLDFLNNFDAFENKFVIEFTRSNLKANLLSFNWENLQTIELISLPCSGQRNLEIFVQKPKIGKNLELEGFGPHFFKKTLKIS